MKYLVIFLSVIYGQTVYGQKSVNDLIDQKEYNWTVDSSSKQIVIYYQRDGWTSKRVDQVKKRLIADIDSAKAFIGIGHYPPKIHFFIAEDSEQMKTLVGFETNGRAIPKYNLITGIISEKTAIFGAHEFFHIIATNVWGRPEPWINEGMAVYSDKKWHGYDLYQLTKYLVDNNRYVPLITLIKKFRKSDNLLAYPLMGSFIKYLDNTYGRPILLEIWRGNRKALQRVTGKKTSELEQAWLAKVKMTSYTDIKY